MKTNKQNKTNTENKSELQNRTEQLSETETASANTQTQTPETKTAPETVTQNAPVKPYVNFAERDFNRELLGRMRDRQKGGHEGPPRDTPPKR